MLRNSLHVSIFVLIFLNESGYCVLETLTDKMFFLLGILFFFKAFITSSYWNRNLSSFKRKIQTAIFGNPEWVHNLELEECLYSYLGFYPAIFLFERYHKFSSYQNSNSHKRSGLCTDELLLNSIGDKIVGIIETSRDKRLIVPIENFASIENFYHVCGVISHMIIDWCI